MTRTSSISALALFFSVQLLAAESPESLSSFSFEELLNIEVETAGKIKQQSDKAPAIIATLSHADIAAFGANTLYEVLDRLPSVQMMGSFFYPQNLAVIRGQQLTHSNNEVLILLNGRPMRDSFTGGQNFAIFSAFPVSSIERIEIIRGPGSVLYGSNAFTGVINVITQSGNGNNANVLIGSDDTLNLDFSYGKESLDGYWQVAGKVLSEDGWQHSALDNAQSPGKFSAGEDNNSVIFTGKYHDFTWSSGWWQSKQDFWGATSTWAGLPPQSQRQVESNRALIDIGYRAELSETRYINSNLSYTSSDFSHYNYDAKSQNWLVESTYHDTEFANGHLLAGATIWHQDVATYSGLRDAPIPSFSRNWVNAYAQYQSQFETPLNGFAGIQYNKVPDVDGNWVLRAGLQWQLAEHRGFKLLLGEAFRAAYGVETNFDLVVCCDAQGNNRGGLRGNPALAPEEITTFELQYYQSQENSRLAVTFFRSKLSNLIERERAADRVIDFVNAGELNSSGLELEWRHIIDDSLQIDASFTYQKNDSHGMDNYTLMPNWLAKLGVRKTFTNNANLSFFLNSQDSFASNAIRNPASLLINPTAGQRHELSLQYRHPVNIWSDHTSYLQLYITNALNDDLYQPEIAGRTINTHPAGAGRRFYLGLQTSF